MASESIPAKPVDSNSVETVHEILASTAQTANEISTSLDAITADLTSAHNCEQESPVAVRQSVLTILSRDTESRRSRLNEILNQASHATDESLAPVPSQPRRPQSTTARSAQTRHLRAARLREMINRQAMHHMFTPQQHVDEQADDLTCCSPCCSILQTVSDKRRYKNAVKCLLFAWYALTLVLTPTALLMYAKYGSCGINTDLVRGIGDSTDTLKYWLTYAILLAVIDVPRLPLKEWAKKMYGSLTAVEASESSNQAVTNAPQQQQHTFQTRLNTTSFKTAATAAAKIITKTQRPFYTILWILITLWHLAGTVWLAAGVPCQTTNPPLYLFCMLYVCLSWALGLWWHTLSRWRSWHLSNLQIIQHRDQVAATHALGIAGYPEIWMDNHFLISDFRHDPFYNGRYARYRHAMLAHHMEDRYVMPVVGESSRTGRSVVGGRRMGRGSGSGGGVAGVGRGIGAMGIDPDVLELMMNTVTSDFWAPVDPGSTRDAIETGVKKEHWDRLKVYVYEKDVSGSGQQESPIVLPQRDSVVTIQGNDKQEPNSPGPCVVLSFDGCIICLCEFEDGDVVRELQCRHEFHDECIYRWLKAKSEGGEGKKTCPVCVSNV